MAYSQLNLLLFNMQYIKYAKVTESLFTVKITVKQKASYSFE